jgi:LmbE family N-acetylglucosaminyl deacetylase
LSGWPAIFYSPHQDDEALGMAGAIAEHKEVGRPVYLVLLSDGHPSASMQDILNGHADCGWHGGRHNFRLSVDQMIWARTIEFVASARALNVDRVFIARNGGIGDLLSVGDYPELVRLIRRTILWFETAYPGASHKLISGKYDVGVGGSSNPTHLACWEAAHDLTGYISDFRFYRPYRYGGYVQPVSPSWSRPLGLRWLTQKRAALDEYRRFDPANGRYAFGYHSVGGLIDAASSTPLEYIDLP